MRTVKRLWWRLCDRIDKAYLQWAINTNMRDADE